MLETALEQIVHQRGRAAADVDHARSCIESRAQQQLDRHLEMRHETS